MNLMPDIYSNSHTSLGGWGLIPGIYSNSHTSPGEPVSLIPVIHSNSHTSPGSNNHDICNLQKCRIPLYDDIEQCRFCIDFIMYTKEMHQYGTVQYRVYTGYTVSRLGIRSMTMTMTMICGMVSGRCAKRHHWAWCRVPEIRYGGDSSFFRTAVLEQCHPVLDCLLGETGKHTDRVA